MTSRSHVPAAALLALGALLAAPDPARAGGFGIPEIGVRRTAMAAVVGRPDDPSAIYHNPAGLVLQRGWRLYLSMGLSLLDTELELQPWDHSDRFLGPAGADGYYAPVRPTRALGVIPMLAATGELIPDRLVLGAAVYVGNATGAAFPDDAVTRYHLIDGYVVAPQAVVSAAYRVHRTLALGAAAGVIHLRVHGKRHQFPVMANGDLTPVLGSDAEVVFDGSDWAPTWMLGAFGQPHPRISWGVSLTGRVDPVLSGPIELTYGSDGNPPGDRYTAVQTTTGLVLPWAVMAGVNADATPNLELGAEYRHWLYRQYDGQQTVIAGIFPIRELPPVTKDYRDSWEASGGLRVHDLARAPALDVMLGVQYDRTPAPPETVTLDQPSFSHWGLHGGARWQTGRYRFGASYIHYWYEVPTITGSITSPPSNVRGRGGNDIFTVSVEARL